VDSRAGEQVSAAPLLTYRVSVEERESDDGRAFWYATILRVERDGFELETLHQESGEALLTDVAWFEQLSRARKCHDCGASLARGNRSIGEPWLCVRCDCKAIRRRA
jgi:hypothetical protein